MLIDELPGAINMLIAKLEEWDLGSEKIINALSTIDWKSKIGEIAKTLTSGLGSVVDVAFTAVTSVFSLLSNGIIGFIFALYLLLSKDNLSKQIKKHRTMLGLSQEDFADKIFVTRQTVSNWENDKNYPDINSLVLMTEIFGISLDSLVKGDIEKMQEEIKKEDSMSTITTVNQDEDTEEENPF